MTHTPASLIAFRDRVADAFRDKRIRSPVHFPSDSQAEPLVNIFKDFRPGDWLFSGWRSQWHALLAGIPDDELFQMILDGRSMYIMDRERRVFCSSIVGGILPIALGVAAGCKKRPDCHECDSYGVRHYLGGMDGDSPRTRWCDCIPKVWVFIGDMTERTGLFHEFRQYANGHNLPIRVIVEDNGLSTNTPTEEVWGRRNRRSYPCGEQRYKYTRSHPHVGLMERVNF